MLSSEPGYTKAMQEELIVLVNDQGEDIGSAPKLASHHADTPLHRAFSCYIFNDNGELLITQRALSKKVWPSVWTNSVCGHPAPGESFEAAIERRAEQELGMQVSDIQVVLPDYHYHTPPYNGVIENEICPVYIAKLKTQPQPNPDEVENMQWLSWPGYADFLKDNADQCSYWAKDQFNQLAGHPLIIVASKK